MKKFEKVAVNFKPMVLNGDDVLEINGTHFVQNGSIFLSGNARLVIRDSLFEHVHDYSFQHWLHASGNASVVVTDSEIRSSDWLNWNFNESASLQFIGVEQEKSGIWHGFSGNATASATRSKFRGTMADNVSFDVEDSPHTFIEMVFPAGSKVDEELSSALENYSFPNNWEENILFKLAMRNSTAKSWGITVNPESDVTIRNSHSLVVTFTVGWPWMNETVKLDNLRVKNYVDAEWSIVDTKLRLVNVSTERWSPIAWMNNTLILTNSELADNAFSGGNAKVFIENSSAIFLRAQQNVEMTVSNSHIDGDVVAMDDGIILLRNVTITGKKATEGNGRIIG